VLPTDTLESVTERGTPSALKEINTTETSNDSKGVSIVSALVMFVQSKPRGEIKFWMKTCAWKPLSLFSSYQLYEFM
jgi:hypothetical protein